MEEMLTQCMFAYLWLLLLQVGALPVNHSIDRDPITDEISTLTNEVERSRSSVVAQIGNRNYSLWSPKSLQNVASKKCLNISIQMEAKVIVLEWIDVDSSHSTLYRNLSLHIGMGKAEKTTRFWISQVSAWFQTENINFNMTTGRQFINVRSIETNPFGATFREDVSYLCDEPRSTEMDTFLVTEGIKGITRKLKTSVMTLKWIGLYHQHHVQSHHQVNFTSCFHHSRDFVPKVVGFTLLGVCVFIITFWFIGRKRIQPAVSGYNIQTNNM